MVLEFNIFSAMAGTPRAAADVLRQTYGDLARYQAEMRADAALSEGWLDARQFGLDVLGCLMRCGAIEPNGKT